MKYLAKYKELILYGVCGCGATLINIVVFHLLYTALSIPLLPANVIAWCIAFVFAFVTNKLVVFESKSWKGEQAIKEMLGFLIARLGTLLLDSGLMWLFVLRWLWDGLLSKILVNVIVIVANYVLSKYLIFGKH